MKAAMTPVDGARLIDLEPFIDQRGIFAEGHVREKLAAVGVEFDVRRVHLVRNERAGTVRGMHWQRAPWAQGKIVMSAAGRIFDAIVDVRPASPTYGKSFSVELFPLANALFIPKGVAHGCQALEDLATLIYLVDNDYVPSHEAGLRPDDPDVRIPWPLPLFNVNKRDLSWPTLREMQNASPA